MPVSDLSLQASDSPLALTVNCSWCHGGGEAALELQYRVLHRTKRSVCHPAGPRRLHAWLSTLLRCFLLTKGSHDASSVWLAHTAGSSEREPMRCFSSLRSATHLAKLPLRGARACVPWEAMKACIHATSWHLSR